MKRYPLKGKVISVDKENKKVEVDHDEIEGYMPRMTMKFLIKNSDWVFNDLQKDADIRAELVVDNPNGEYWLENIGIIAAANPNQALPINPDFAQIGKEAPDFKLTNQDGKQISFSDFKGKAFAITFIYSRCPLPEYCVKMSMNFSDAAIALQNKPSPLRDNARLLSISFDPATDTPAKLREYGLGYLGRSAKPELTIWQLAVAPEKEVREIADFFGLRYEIDQNDKTQFNHSLRTAIIGPDGKVKEIIAGNEWTGNDLVGKLEEALR